MKQEGQFKSFAMAALFMPTCAVRDYAPAYTVQVGVAGPPRMGFHCMPSMRQLHLHVMSPDLLGTSMKRKGQWNSFATAFFVPPSKVSLFTLTRLNMLCTLPPHCAFVNLGLRVHPVTCSADMSAYCRLAPCATLCAALATQPTAHVRVPDRASSTATCHRRCLLPWQTPGTTA
jgi:hypothetical protein